VKIKELSLGLLVLMATGRVWGQGATATVLGTITDMTGAVVPGTNLEILNVATGYKQTSTTDGEGRYRVAEVPVGTYDIRATKPGFVTTVEHDLVLAVGSQLVVDLSLPVGGQQQVVTVQTDVTQVETTTAAVATLIDQQQIVELPLNGRNFEQLILLAPGVQSFTAFSSNSLQGRANEISIGGSRTTGFGILLDDENIVNFWNRGMGSITGTSLGVEAIGEFQTLTNTYGAQFGGSGAVINSVSKSGTNALHGSAFEFLRNDVTDAWDTFAKRAVNPIKPPLRKNQFGGSLGGPVEKDKMFFFVNYEGIQQSTGVTRVATVPNCPAACAVTNTNANTAALLQQILNIFPKPDPGTVLPGAASGTSTQVATRPASEDYILARFDYNISSKDSLFARYLSDVENAKDPFSGSFGQATLPFWTESDHGHSQFSTVEYRRIFSPTVVNIARVSFSRPEQDAATTTSQTPLQFPGFQGLEDGAVSITGLSPIGASISTPFIYLENKFAESDDVLWTRGSHSMRFGLTVLRRDSNIYVPVRESPQWTFGSLAQFLAGNASAVSGIIPSPQNYPSREFRGVEIYPYFQDDWKVTPRLTVNLGLRYEFETNPIEAHNEVYAITNFATATFFTNVPHVMQSNPSFHNFAPRVGLAWDPFADHKTSIRGGFGMFYDMVGPEHYSTGLNNEYPWFNVSQTSPPPTFPFAFAGFTPTCVNSAGVCPTDSPGWGWNTDTTPYVIQYNLTVQREIKKTGVLSVGYVGNHGIHEFTGLEQNPPVPTIVNGVPEFAALAVNPATGLVFIRTNNRINGNLGQFPDAQPISTSRYSALQAAFNRRFQNNVQVQASYAYSHCTDNGAFYIGSFNSNSSGTVSDPYNQSIDKGLCVADITQTLRVNGIWALPFQKTVFLRGWQISGIVSATSGLPFTVTDGAFQSGAGIGGRPDYISGCEVTSGTFNGRQVGTPSLYFNPGCFALEPVGTIGDMGRTNVRGPGLADADIAILKDMKFKERLRAQFRAEFFNAFNHPSYSLPAAAVFTQQTANGNATGGGNLSPTAGLITSVVVPARQIQFALRLNF